MNALSDAAGVTSFSELDLPGPLLAALGEMGYEAPTPIQALTIPALLQGQDLVGQAQTGTGKTAAFAIPLLARLDPGLNAPQALVLTPTRELALQVAEAFRQHAAHLPGVRVLPIYGGQGYGPQLSGLKRGAQVVVGTPGRVMDHLERGTLQLSSLRALVLDEADEMLNMGFLDDVEWILERTPQTRQTALFSATMPPEVRRIAQRHLRSPAEVSLDRRTTAAETIRQRYVVVAARDKVDALLRILEVEATSGVLIFVRTRSAATELAEELERRGHRASALSGELSQVQRERTVEALRRGQLDLLVATDVAARGLDVERISHVFNFEAPGDPEVYVHRIGRTGRAGKRGEAILFLTPRERHLARAIARATGQALEPMKVPGAAAINEARLEALFTRIDQALEAASLGPFEELVERYLARRDLPPERLAAALAHLIQDGAPLLIEGELRDLDAELPRPKRQERPERPERARRPQRDQAGPGLAMERFRVEVGLRNALKPGNLVGAIANEAGLDSRQIGKIEIHDEWSTIELPEGMPKEVLRGLQRVWVCRRQLRMSRLGEPSEQPRPRPVDRRRETRRAAHQAQ